MNRILTLLTLALSLATPRLAHAFCGFYVGKAGAELYNHASKVVLARDGDRTVITMSNDFQGNLKDFALVVPVPTAITRDQVHVGEKRLVDRIDAYSAPRLVKYVDPDPCQIRRYKYESKKAMPSASMGAGRAARDEDDRAAALGVKIEDRYTVGEYDILILSAKESEGLETWLRESGYQIPPRASAALQPYIKQEMKFFVAKVNLAKQESSGFTYLRPIQIAYESPKFMLPIRLGMANAQGAQDLLVFTLTRRGRVESANYKTVKIPSDAEVPLYVRDEFAKFYAAVFERAHAKENYRAVHTEYVWNAGWCDPCADNPLTPEELRGLGVFWMDQGGGQPIITRLHVRYDHEHFPEDLVFQETGDQQNFQARYILREPFRGSLSCAAGESYRQQLAERHKQELETAVALTGWKRDEVKRKMGPDAPGSADPASEPWYKKLWK